MAIYTIRESAKLARFISPKLTNFSIVDGTTARGSWAIELCYDLHQECKDVETSDLFLIINEEKLISHDQ